MNYPSDSEDLHEQAPQTDSPSLGGRIWASIVGFADSTEEDLLRQPWLRNHGWFILTCLACLTLAIVWPYYCKQQITEVGRLEQQVTDIRYRSLITTAALIEHERVGNILQRIEGYQLQLVPAVAPPYLLVDSGQHPLSAPLAK